LERDETRSRLSSQNKTGRLLPRNGGTPWNTSERLPTHGRHQPGDADVFSACGRRPQRRCTARPRCNRRPATPLPSPRSPVVSTPQIVDQGLRLLV